jgi:hypothetical protein
VPYKTLFSIAGINQNDERNEDVRMAGSSLGAYYRSLGKKARRVDLSRWLLAADRPSPFEVPIDSEDQSSWMISERAVGMLSGTLWRLLGRPRRELGHPRGP